jgi:hypothetical protein
MTEAGTRKGVVINGYKCLGDTKDGTWSQFKLDNSAEWTQERRDEWERERRFQQALKAAEDEAKAKQSLTEQERHKQYTALLSELTLHPKDRADLIGRGFTTREIELSGFKSVDNWQKLKGTYSSLLPGIGIGGKRLLTNKGYLCPVRNHNGLIVALQVRLREVKSGEGRYRWLSSVTKNKPDGQSPHTYTKGFTPQLPLAVHKPQGKPKGIALAEGTGTKPFLAAQRLDLIVIGAAGGQHASSPDSLKSALSLCPEIKEIPILADAGSVTNRNVINQYQRTFKLLKSWGITPAIAWWNQVSKNDPDIDELPTERYSEIQYISVEEFETIAREYGGLEPVGYREQLLANYLKKRKFTADIITNSKYFDAISKYAKKGSIFFGRSGTGSGKSTDLTKFVTIEKLRQEFEDVGFIILGYRNPLLLQQCERLGFYHIHDEDSALVRLNPNGGIALCVNSILKLSLEYFDDKIIILDEVLSVIKHLLASKTIRNRDKVLEWFKEAICRARQVICLDGMLPDWCVQYLHKLAPEKKIITVENVYKRERAKVNFLNGTINSEKIKVNDRSPWHKMLIDLATTPAICADSQVMIEAYDEILTAQGLKVLRIDSKTVAEDSVKEALQNIDTYIEKHNIDALLYTPSAESGVDISIPNYFSHHFGFFFGLIDVDSIVQMIGRIRDSNCEKYIWVKEFVAQDEKTGLNSPHAKTIEKAMQQLLLSDIDSSLIGSDDFAEKHLEHIKSVLLNSCDIHYQTACLIHSMRNYEMSNLRKCVKEVLIEQGYKVVDQVLESSEEHGKRVKDEGNEVKKRNCHDIFTAKMIDPQLIPELNFDASWEKRCEMTNAKLRERLPGIENTPSWNEELIYKTQYGQRDYIGSLEMYYLFKHPEIAKHQRQRNFHYIARGPKTFIQIKRSQWSTINALHEIGFEKIVTHLETGGTLSTESPEVIELVEKCRKPEIANILGNPGKQTPTQYIGRLLQKLGLKRKSNQSHNGKRTYSLDLEILNSPDRMNILSCIDTKWNKEPQQLDWEAAINEAHGIVPKKIETQTEQALQTTSQTTDEIAISDSSPSAESLITKIEELAKELKLCQSIQDFQAIADGVFSKGGNHQDIDDGILFTGNQLYRPQLYNWHQAYQDTSFLNSVTDWSEITLSQSRLDTAWGLLSPIKQEQLSLLCQQYQRRDQTESQDKNVSQPQKQPWGKLPLIGTIVQWVIKNWGNQKLTIKAVSPDGQCQLEGFDGRLWDSHIGWVMPTLG